MVRSWVLARDRAAAAISAGHDAVASEAYQDMAAIEKTAARSGSLADRLALAVLAAKEDACGEELSPAWDIVEGVLRDVSN